MPDKIESIPEEARWEIATKGLTGAYIAISNALKQAVGQKKSEEFNGALWYGAGKGAKEFVGSLGRRLHVDDNARTVPPAMADKLHKLLFTLETATGLD